MGEEPVERSFAWPVALLFAGAVLGFLALAWLVFGTGQFIEIDGPIADPAQPRPWLAVGAGIASATCLWLGVRSLRGRP